MSKTTTATSSSAGAAKGNWATIIGCETAEEVRAYAASADRKEILTVQENQDGTFRVFECSEFDNIPELNALFGKVAGDPNFKGQLNGSLMRAGRALKAGQDLTEVLVAYDLLVFAATCVPGGAHGNGQGHGLPRRRGDRGWIENVLDRP